MAIHPIQMNNQTKLVFKQAYKPYLDAKETITTENNVKPLKPEGYLIKDNFASSIKYFFKDRAYELKAVKDGLAGTANDHQLGRLNDVGLVGAGLLIATFLASKTTNPKARLMEYIGLGAFLSAMVIYPKLAINAPAKLKHGFDIDKQYIDDQGRKKSVMQDSNYVPYDMYLAEIPEEDLSIIGDKMGIPRDIKNRNDVIREQMRKISTQNNTLWMLTAGITPAIGALLCCGLENYLIAPALEKSRNAKFNKQITQLLNKTTEMLTDVKSIKSNSLSNEVAHVLAQYQGQEIPKDEVEHLIKLISKDLDLSTGDGIRKDIVKILKTPTGEGAVAREFSKDLIKEVKDTIADSINGRHKKALEKILVPSQDELEKILNSVKNKNDISEIRLTLNNFLESRLKTVEGMPKDFLNLQKNEILENIIKKFKSEEFFYVTKDSTEQIKTLAKIIGEFKENKKLLDKCTSFKFEQAPETVLARSYSKFEKTLLDVLDIKFKDLKKMRESESYTKELLDKKLSELCKDEKRYQKAIEKLGNVFSEMEVALNGSNETKSYITDLINAIENNYNITAKRLSNAGGFETTIDRLVKQDVKTLGNSVSNRRELFDFLDGIIENKAPSKLGSVEEKLKYITENSGGVGSAKNLEISRIVDRYQSVRNSFSRILHTFDVYKRAQSPEEFMRLLKNKSPEYTEAILKKGKDALLNATSSDHTLKLDLINNPEFYKDLMNSIWAGESGNHLSTKQKGILTERTKNALSKNNTMQAGNILDRMQYYITRFRNLIGNNNIDFTKPEHKLTNGIEKCYTQGERTRLSLFNLISQSPTDMARGAASRRYSTQKWVRIISAITGSVFGIALLAQAGFGKLSNPQNLQKQVNDDKN